MVNTLGLAKIVVRMLDIINLITKQVDLQQIVEGMMSPQDLRVEAIIIIRRVPGITEREVAAQAAAHTHAVAAQVIRESEIARGAIPVMRGKDHLDLQRNRVCFTRIRSTAILLSKRGSILLKEIPRDLINQLR